MRPIFCIHRCNGARVTSRNAPYNLDSLAVGDAPSADGDTFVTLQATALDATARGLLATLGHGDIFYYIPSYQRGYSWDLGRAVELLNALWEVSGAEHAVKQHHLTELRGNG